MTRRKLAETHCSKWFAKSVCGEGLSKSFAEIRMADLGNRKGGLTPEMADYSGYEQKFGVPCLPFAS